MILSIEYIIIYLYFVQVLIDIITNIPIMKHHYKSCTF